VKLTAKATLALALKQAVYRAILVILQVVIIGVTVPLTVFFALAVAEQRQVVRPELKCHRLLGLAPVEIRLMVRTILFLITIAAVKPVVLVVYVTAMKMTNPPIDHKRITILTGV
jgi:hypothetical protein